MYIAFTKRQQITHTRLPLGVNEAFTKTTHNMNLRPTLLRSGDALAFTESINASSCFRPYPGLC